MTQGNTWHGWMIFSRKGNQIGIVPSSFSMVKEAAETTLKTRGRANEELRKVSITIEDD